jgi:hypothetical protein
MSEIDEIRQKYDAGQLEAIKQDLERFVVAHRGAVATYRAEQEKRGLRLTDEAAIKFYILRHRSINPQREIRDQLEEIQREKWIRGIQLGRPPDAQEVAREWTQKHSAHWRSHRITTIIYVFEREKERYIRLLTP